MSENNGEKNGAVYDYDRVPPKPRAHVLGERDEYSYWVTTCMSPSGARGCYREWRVYTEHEALRVFICPECRGA